MTAHKRLVREKKRKEEEAGVPLRGLERAVLFLVYLQLAYMWWMRDFRLLEDARYSSAGTVSPALSGVLSHWCFSICVLQFLVPMQYLGPIHFSPKGGNPRTQGSSCIEELEGSREPSGVCR